MDAGKVQQKLSQELLFNEMRNFGRMEDIYVDSKKENGYIIFSSTNSAISARNCIHLKSIGDTQLYLRYEPYSRFNQARELVKNPKILIPLLGIAITLCTYLLVDPIRLTSVTQKITRGYKDDEVQDQESPPRDDLLLMLKKQLRNAPNSTLLLTGPSGTGKSHLVRKLLNRRAFTIRVDCRGIKSVESFIEHFGDAIAFSPSFHALSNLLGWLESFIPGLKKTALSPSIEHQLQSMLICLDRVLFLVSAGYPTDKREWDYPIIAFDGFPELIDTFDNSAEKEKADVLVDILLKWVVRNSSKAHIVFLGENYFGEEAIKQSIIYLLKMNYLHLTNR